MPTPNPNADEPLPGRWNAGRAGLYLSLVAPATVALMVLLHPG
jgi:hypothetical protein